MYPTYTRQGLTGIIGAAGARQLLNGLNEQINVQTFGATGEGYIDDTAKIQKAIDYASSLTTRNKTIVFPAGDYLIQDPDSAAHTAQSDGVLRIAPGVYGITIIGYGARLILGSRGAGTAMLRNFGGRLKVLGLEFDLNGTVPDGSKANVAFQSSGSHASSVTNLDGCDVWIQDCYIHGSRYRDEYTTGTIIYDHTGNGSGERVVILTGGTWPALAATNGRISISGTWYDVAARVSDTVLQLNSGASNNPGSDVGSTTYTFRGEPYKNQGRDGIQILNGRRCTAFNNRLTDIGWSAIRMSGRDNVIAFNTVKDQRGNGIRTIDHNRLLIVGNDIRSQYCSGRSCIIADAGSSADSGPTSNSDVRVGQLVIRDNYCEATTDGDFEGAASVLKIASVRDCLVDGGEYIAGTQTNNVAIRIEDCVRRLKFTNQVRCVGPLKQTGVCHAAVSAEISRASGTYTGKSQLTIASHGLVAGKSVFLHNAPTAIFDEREFIVLEVVDGNNVVIGYVSDEDGTVTPLPYNGGGVSNMQAHGGVHDLVFEDCIFERGQHDYNQFLDSLFSPYLSVERCSFEMTTPKSALVKESGILLDYNSDLAIRHLRLVKNKFLFNTDKLSRCVRQNNDNSDSSASTMLLTSGKITCYGNVFDNKNTGTVLLVNIYETNDSTASYDDRLILFSTVGESTTIFYGTGVPTESVVTFLDGDEIRNTAPAAAGAPGWICTTPGKSGTWKARASVAA